MTLLWKAFMAGLCLYMGIASTGGGHPVLAAFFFIYLGMYIEEAMQFVAQTWRQS